MNTLEQIQKIKENYRELELTEMVHSFLLKEQVQKNEERKAENREVHFYPSSVGMCKRAVAYSMLGYEPFMNNGQSLLIMENGTSFHNRMENIFERMGIMIAPELSLRSPELKISGRSDAIIWNYLLKPDEAPGKEIVLYRKDEETGEEIEVYRGPENHILICEFKSIKSQNFEKLPQKKPLKKHEMQLQLYFHLTGIRRGLVYYEDKNTQEVKIYMVVYDEAVVEETLAYIRSILSYVERSELPDKEGNPLDFMCRFCNYKTTCHEPMSEMDLVDLFFHGGEAS